jgi:hypothetical protein
VLYRPKNSAQTDGRTDGQTDGPTDGRHNDFSRAHFFKEENTLTRHKLETCQNWIFELILSLSNIPTDFKPNKQKKSKTLPFYERTFLSEYSLDSVPNEFKKLSFSA